MVKWSKLVNYKYVPRLRNVGFGVTGVIRIVVEILIEVVVSVSVPSDVGIHVHIVVGIEISSVVRIVVTWIWSPIAILHLRAAAESDLDLVAPTKILVSVALKLFLAVAQTVTPQEFQFSLSKVGARVFPPPASLEITVKA